MTKIKLETNILYQGDSAKILADTTKFPDRSVHLIMTSPPYADKRKKAYFGVPAHHYVEWFLPICEQLKRILKDNGSFILNIKEHPANGERGIYVLELILKLREQGWFWIEEYCWYKKNSFPGYWPNRFRDSWERCLHFTKNKNFRMFQNEVKVPIGDWAEKRFKSMSEDDFIRRVSKNNSHLSRNVSNWLNKKKVFPHNVIVFDEEHRLEYGNVGNVIESAADTSHKNHSAIFPIELPTWFMHLFTKPKDIVLDPFVGSGTTAVGAVMSGRQYIGIELKLEYFKEALKNVSDIKQVMQLHTNQSSRKRENSDNLKPKSKSQTNAF